MTHPGELSTRREHMVSRHLQARGISDARVLEAFRRVPREAFLPGEMSEFAYEDSPLPIGQGQTISQPYIVALMVQALRLSPTDRVLEIGAGSGYAAAILGAVAAEVHTIERHAELAEAAGARLSQLGFDRVHVHHADGTLGWSQAAPYDAIVVAAGGPRVPAALVEQLAPGGRLVMPVGEERDLQHLVRVTRRPDGRIETEELAGVRFVPLIGAEGWDGTPPAGPGARHSFSAPVRPASLCHLIRDCAEPLESIDEAALGSLLERVAGARVVLLGESTHGTSEFYRMRNCITRTLVEHAGFQFVAIEGDWPDAARIDDYVRPGARPPRDWQAFSRFPRWMWRNHETLDLIEWLRAFNRGRDPDSAVGFHGLDLYSLFTSIQMVLSYLDRVDPDAARVARERYGCLSPWESDPATYGRAVLRGHYRACEAQAVATLEEMLERRLDYEAHDGGSFLDATANARLIRNAERYYRVMYHGSTQSWNLRDEHMFSTLQALLEHHGPGSRGIVWAHNSHVADARATEWAARGQLDLGQLCREHLGDEAYLIGQGTDSGTVAAAHEWDGAVEIMDVRPSRSDSYESLCHQTSLAAFNLPLRHAHADELVDELADARLLRAIGVVYRPQTELQSHYFHASLPGAFDEWIWIDRTTAVRPVPASTARRLDRSHPFFATRRR